MPEHEAPNGPVTTGLGNLLAFADRLARLKSHLEWAARGGPGTQDDAGYGDVARSQLVLLDALQNGHEPAAAVAVAAQAWEEYDRRSRQAEHARREQIRAEGERARAEEEITRRVECPSCCAPPRALCHSMTGRQSTTAESRRARYHLARGLSDG